MSNKQTKRVTLLWFSLFVFNVGYSQYFASGTIVDSKNSPIPFVHVISKKHAVGTVSNHNGMFQLWLPHGNFHDELFLSCIGYQPRTLSVTNKFQRILLAEDVIDLEEITITPRGYARELIEKAIENIPKNYPERTERLMGFIRESAYWKKDGEQKPLYVVESVIESIKKPYQKSSTNGEVMLVEGRKYKSSGLDTLKTRIYAGPHHAHRFDIISTRSAFLKNSDEYDFEICDTLRLNHSNLFEINFRHKKGSSFGSVYVTDSAFAIAKMTITYTEFSSLRPILILKKRDRKLLKYEAIYYQGDDEKWRLERTDYLSFFAKQSNHLVLKSDYVTTQISPNKVPIPYVDRIQFRDIFLDNTGTYDSSFWKHYNIILPDSVIAGLFRDQSRITLTQSEGPVRTKRHRFHEVLRKFKFSYVVGYNQLNVDDYSISFSNTEFSINELKERYNAQLINLSLELLYEWNPSFFVGIRPTSSFIGISNRSIDLEFLKEVNINPKGRPVLIYPKLFIGYQQLSKSLGEFGSKSAFSVNGKDFDSGRTKVYLQQRGLRIAPELSLGIELNHQIQLFLSGNYNFPVRQKVGLHFIETNQFFLKQKNAFLDNGKEGLTIDSDTVFKNNWSLSLGVYVNF